jgi:hypothetical protein
MSPLRVKIGRKAFLLDFASSCLPCTEDLLGLDDPIVATRACAGPSTPAERAAPGVEGYTNAKTGSTWNRFLARVFARVRTPPWGLLRSDFLIKRAQVRDAPMGILVMELMIVLRPGFETPDCAYSGCQG